MSNYYNRTKSNLLLDGFFTSSHFKFLEGYNQNHPFLNLGHNLMLQDRDRLEFYRDLIRDKVKNKIVLDVGAGTGILSFLCLKYGAKKVYSVERNPLFQDLYSQFMRDSLEKRSAFLIQKDAKEIEPSDLLGDRPDIIIHELLGSSIYEEEIIGIFQSLEKKGFLTETQILPSEFAIKTRAINCPELVQKSIIEDFEGFPLHKMQELASWTPFKMDYIRSNLLSKNTVSIDQVLYKENLYALKNPDPFELNFSCTEEATHLHTWIEIYDEGRILSSDHQKYQSHWSNSYFPLPPWFKDKQSFKAQFKFLDNRLYLSSVKSS